MNLDKPIERVTQSCTCCSALSQAPRARTEQSSCEPPDAVGISFAAVLWRSRQIVLILREFMTSYTSPLVLEDKRHNTLRDGLIRLFIQLRPLHSPPAIVRTAPAPGFMVFVNDRQLQHHRIVLEIRNPKSSNDNSVEERAVQELERELLRQEPLGCAVTEKILAVSTATLNSLNSPLVSRQSSHNGYRVFRVYIQIVILSLLVHVLFKISVIPFQYEKREVTPVPVSGTLLVSSLPP